MKTDTNINTTKEQATQLAHLLLSKIKYSGFKIKVWENLGWHYSVENDWVSVTPSHTNNEYFALLKPHYCYYGHGQNNRDVNLLIRDTIQLQVNHAVEETDRANKALASLKPI